jgi:hypothetical protein
VTFKQNLETCCSLGMKPLTMDSAYEQQCLSNLTKSSNWTGNHNYWSGGTQQGCRNSWGWCGNTAGPVGISDDIKWETGQPDNLGGRQDCIHLKNIPGTGLQMTDRNCTDKYVLACKVEIEVKLITPKCKQLLVFRGIPKQNQLPSLQTARRLCALKM